ncbi:hypothetical protein MJO29_014629 [Puccinia striiformis f. sp. tritici]|nr:hypothetical protein MJO29_014629 [Puccinia striiformis f. sp. tritici]
MSLGESATEVINKDLAGASILFNLPHFPPHNSSVKFFVKIMRSQFVLITFIATACCMELTKLKEDSGDSIALNELASNAPSNEPKSTYFNRDQSNPERQNFAHCGAEASFRPVAHEQVTNPSRKEFTNLIEDSPLKDLHPRKHQVLSLATDWEEILNQQKWEELLLDDGTEHQVGTLNRLSNSSRDLCVKIKDRLNLLKEKRLLQLGGLNSPKFQNQATFEVLKLNYDQDSRMKKYIEGYPSDMVDRIVKETWEKISWSILDDIKQIIINQKSLPKHQKKSGEKALIPAVKYLFKTMDLLYKQGFIGGEDLRTYVLNDKELVNDLINYVRSSFANEKYVSENLEQMWIGGESVTDHWYFLPMHKVFEVFGEKDKEIINLYYLEAKILELGTKLQQSNQITPKFQENWASFSVQGHIDTLNKIIKQSNQSNRNAKKGILKMEISVDERNSMKLQLERMIQLLHELYLDPDSKAYDGYYGSWLHITDASLLYTSICQLIKFTERNISRDVVEEIEAETIHSGALNPLNFRGSRAERQAALSSTKLIQYMGFTDTLAHLLSEGEDFIYLKKNGAYLKSKIKDYLSEFSQEIIEFNHNHQMARLDQTIFGKDVLDFLNEVNLDREMSTEVLKVGLEAESLDIVKRTWLAQSLLFNLPHFPASDSSVFFSVETMRSRLVLGMFIATACCMELTKLKEESSDSIALNDLASNEQKSAYINRDQSTLKRRDFAHCGAETSFWPVAHEQAENSRREEFANLIKDSPWKDLHPKKPYNFKDLMITEISLLYSGFILLRSWERNADQVLSLATDMEEILNQQKWEELLLDDGTEYQTKETNRLSDSSRDLCVKIKDGLNLLKEKRLLQLGGLDSRFQDRRTFGFLKLNLDEDPQMEEQIGDYPLDVFNLVMKVKWEKLSWSILDDIKQIIIDQISLPKHQKTSGAKVSIPAVQYLLKTMDSLYKQGFIKGDNVRTYVLHDKELVDGLMDYVRSSFANIKYILENHTQIWIGDDYIIDLYSLEAKILKLGTKLQQSNNITQEFQGKWASFSVQKYIDALKKIKSINSQH